MRALIIDDDKKMTELLSEYFKKFNIHLISAHHPHEGLSLLRQKKPDIVILDIMLPDQDGLSLCQEIRQESSIPIMMLTARGDTTDKIVGLELGADDYLGKPFEPRELVARMQAILKRSVKTIEKEVLKFDSLEIKTRERTASLNGVDINLTANEYELLYYFAKHPQEKIDRDQIMNHLQGIDSNAFSRSVDILISRLRNKLGEDSTQPRFIKTIRGIGYIFTGKRE